MAALLKVNKIHDLQNDVFLALDKITNKQFTRTTAALSTHIIGIDLRVVFNFLKILRHVETLHVKHPTRNRVYRTIVKLITSCNDLDNADSHPVGQDLSVDMYAKIAQDLLNVKRYVAKNKLKDESKLDDVEQYLHSKKLNTHRIMPILHDNIIHEHTNNKSWFRLKVCWSNRLENIKTIIMDAKLSIDLEGICFLSNDVVELYYNKINIKLYDYIVAIDGLSFVTNIIFYSNLKLFKSKCQCEYTKLSNILKFYYCCVNKFSDFTISGVGNLETFNRLYLYSTLLLHKNNLGISTDDFSPNPMACLAGNGPGRTVRAKSQKVQKLTEYDKLITESKDVDLRGTAMSRESFAIQMKHTTYTVSQDREMRMMHGQPLIGGCNSHEVVWNIAK